MINDYNIQNMKRLTPTIDQVIHEAEIMGYDTTDPDFMAGPFRKLFARIRARIQERRAKRSGGSDNYSISTPAGSVSYSQQSGLQFLNPQTGLPQTGVPGAVPGAMTQSMIPGGQNINIPGLGQIPLIAVIGVPLLLFAIMNKKKKK